MAKKPTQVQVASYQRGAKTSFYVFAGKLSLLFLAIAIVLFIERQVGFGLLLVLLSVANFIIRYKLMLRAVDKFSHAEGKDYLGMEAAIKAQKTATAQRTKSVGSVNGKKKTVKKK